MVSAANSRYDQATTSPCRLLPKLTLSPAATGVSGSVTDASLMRIAPSATLRFTSLLEDAKPRPVSACITVMPGPANVTVGRLARSEEHTSELQSLMRISYAVFCLKKKTTTPQQNKTQESSHS